MGKNGAEKRADAEGADDDEPNLHFCVLEIE